MNIHPTIPTIYQSPADLILATLRADVVLDVTVLKSHHLRLAGWHFEWVIIGESHVVIISHDGQVILREVLACMSLSSADCAVYRTFQGLQNVDVAEDRYRVSVEFITLPASADGLEAHIPALSPHGIEYHFPQVHHITPITRIEWRWDDERVYWQTLHVYPTAESCVLVRSQSQFDYSQSRQPFS